MKKFNQPLIYLIYLLYFYFYLFCLHAFMLGAVSTAEQTQGNLFKCHYYIFINYMDFDCGRYSGLLVRA